MPSTKKTKGPRKFRVPIVPSEIKGIILVEGKEELREPFLLWDVSEAGICLWATNKLDIGLGVKLLIGPPFHLNLACRVVWCGDFEENGYRMGLEVINPDERIKELYKKCLIMDETS